MAGQHGSTEQICWIFSITVCSGLLLVNLLVFILVICGLSSKNRNDEEPRSIYISSILCLSFGILGNFLLWTTYPICHIYETCGENFIGDFYFVAIFDTYLLNKVFMYLNIIYRLFDTFDGTSHQYKKSQYFILYLLLFLIFIIFGQLNISTFFAWPPKSADPSFLTLLFVLIYVIIDIILSLFTLYLYIRPLSKLIIEQIQSQKYSMSRDLINSADLRYIQEKYKNNKNTTTFSNKSGKSTSWSIWDGYTKTDYVQQSDWDFSNKTIFIMIKFLVLILFAIISNIIFGGILLVRFSKGWYHSTTQISDCFLDISGIFHMYEILISCIVIYLNFKFANNIYINICKCCHRKGFYFMKKTIKKTVKQLLEETINDDAKGSKNEGDGSSKSVQSKVSQTLLSEDGGNYKILVPSYATQDLKI